MTKGQVRRFANEKISEHLSTPYTVEFSRAKRIGGRCWYGKQVITISTYHMKYESEDQVKDTILHEIAHALDMERNGYNKGDVHGRRWKACAREVGADPSRTVKVDRPESVYNWFKVCPNCDSRRGYYRKPWGKKAKACGKCCNKYNDGKFSYEFELEVKPASEVLAFA